MGTKDNLLALSLQPYPLSRSVQTLSGTKAPSFGSHAGAWEPEK
jgi:hypothetical protein